MAPQALVSRVETLEARVTILEQLPERVDALAVQISQLRDEMHVEFSAVREEARAGHEETRLSLREEIRAGHEETRLSLREEIRVGDEETRRLLREEIRALSDRVGELHASAMSQARTLHEDVIARIALIAEGRSKRRTPKSKG